MISFKKNPYKSPKIRIFEKIRTRTDFFFKIRTCTDKSVRVGTLISTLETTRIWEFSFTRVMIFTFNFFDLTQNFTT